MYHPYRPIGHPEHKEKNMVLYPGGPRIGTPLPEEPETPLDIESD